MKSYHLTKKIIKTTYIDDQLDYKLKWPFEFQKENKSMRFH